MIAERLSDRNHKRTAASLCSELGIDDRELRRQVAAERLSGAPICASSEKGDSGYYLTEDPADIERNRRSLKAKSNELRKVWRAMGETARKLKEQAKNIEKDV